MIMAAHDLESVGYSAPYLAHWAGGDVDVIYAATAEIHWVAQSILEDLQAGDE